MLVTEMFVWPAACFASAVPLESLAERLIGSRRSSSQIRTVAYAFLEASLGSGRLRLVLACTSIAKQQPQADAPDGEH